jgi:uroporphyrin-3 C-methyltransferase
MEELVQSVARARDENLAVDLESAVRGARPGQLTGSVHPRWRPCAPPSALARSSDPRLAPWHAPWRSERVKNANLADTRRPAGAHRPVAARGR